MNQAHFSTKQRLFIVFSVVLASILLTASARSYGNRAHQEDASLPAIEDNTKSLKFESVEKQGHFYLTRMKNISQKAITAYGIAVCEVPTSSTDFTIGDTKIEPGGFVEIITPVRTLSDNCKSTTKPNIRVLAVVFDDKSTDGEYGWALGILEDRRGHKIQLKRINRLLTVALKWRDKDKPIALERLKTEIAALPIDDDKSPAVRGGLEGAKQRVLFFLDELEKWQLSGRSSEHKRAELAGVHSLDEGFSRLISLNEGWISKY
jgi:hypothetical protein